MQGRVFRIIGDWNPIDLIIVQISRKIVHHSDNVIVIATGKRSGKQISGYGHSRRIQVVPVTEEAVKLFGGKEPRWVPKRLLKQINLGKLNHYLKNTK